jgi:DNA adenine methylase
VGGVTGQPTRPIGRRNRSRTRRHAVGGGLARSSSHPDTPAPADEPSASAGGPPFAYYGGKTRLAARIVAAFPEHSHYVDVFGGSLAVLLAKPPARKETVNDLDRELIAFWTVLRNRPDELIRACALTPHSRIEHARAYQPAEDEVERARRVWVRLTQGRSGGLAPTGWKRFLDPNGPRLSMPGYLAGYLTRMPTAAARLARVSLECRPALEAIADYGTHPDTLLYVDPPYLGVASPYRHRMPDQTAHGELAEALHACTAKVVLSGYPSALYEKLYAGWHRTTLTATTRRASRGNPRRVEIFWANHTPADHRAAACDQAAA